MTPGEPMRKRPIFGVIFLLTGLGIFGFLLFRSLLTEVGPPPGVTLPAELRMRGFHRLATYALTIIVIVFGLATIALTAAHAIG